MYNAGFSYEENLKRGPDVSLLKGGIFPRVRYTEKPRFSFLGVPVHIPFGIPAGPLLNARYMQAALDAGFCMPIYKTVRSQAWPCHEWPNILKVETERGALRDGESNTVRGKPFAQEDYAKKNLSITNSFGVPSSSPDLWKKDYLQLPNQMGMAPILSFQGSRKEGGSFDDFVDDACLVARLVGETLAQAGHSFAEINLSCPNEGTVPLFRTPAKAAQMVNAVARTLRIHAPGVRLLAKVGVMDLPTAHQLLSETAGNLHGVSCINTVPAVVWNEYRDAALGAKRPTSGICGAAILDEGLRTVDLMAHVRQKIGLENTLGIIGVGGVFSAEHFAKYRAAGADVVQAATGAMWNLQLAAEVATLCGVPFEELAGE